MRGREQAHAQARRAVDAFKHGANGPLPVRAGDMDEPQSILRISCQGSEFARIFQPELRPEQLQVV